MESFVCRAEWKRRCCSLPQKSTDLWSVVIHLVTISTGYVGCCDFCWQTYSLILTTVKDEQCHFFLTFIYFFLIIKHIICDASCWKWSWFLMSSKVIFICLIQQFTELFLGFLALYHLSCLEAPEQQMAWHHPDSPVSACCFGFSKTRWALNPEYIQKGQTKIRLEQFQSATIKDEHKEPNHPARLLEDREHSNVTEKDKTFLLVWKAIWIR